MSCVCAHVCVYMYIYMFSFFYLPTLVFEEPEDPSNRSFFSEIISSISDVKFSHNGRYMMTRDYLSVKIWDLNMENRPVETYQVSRIAWKKTHKVHQKSASNFSPETFCSSNIVSSSNFSLQNLTEAPHSFNSSADV